MPTKKQLFRNMLAESILGIKSIEHYGDEHLSAEEASIRRAKTKNTVRRMRESDKGEVIGHYIIDEETGDLKLIPKQDEP